MSTMPLSISKIFLWKGSYSKKITNLILVLHVLVKKFSVLIQNFYKVSSLLQV